MPRIATHFVGSTIALAAVFATASAAGAQTAKVPAKLAAMSAADFQARTQIIDDHLEPVTVISTERAFRSTRGLFKSPWNDNHLRAIVDKRTGEARFEVHQKIQYSGVHRGYGEANYQTTGWPVTASVTKIRDNAQNCALVEAAEVCFEDVAFTVDEAQLREIATAGGDTWGFKFKSGVAHEHRAAIVPAEVDGLLRVVDDYRRTLGQAGKVAIAADVSG